MNKITLYILIIIAAGVVFSSCEELDDPLDGLQETDLFVQFGANTPDTVSASEGGSLIITIQAPISFNENLIASVTFSGTAVFGTDFTITANNVISGNTGESVAPIQSVDANGATILVPFLPTRGEDLITDQVNFTVNFLTDEATDGQKILEITLNGATGTVTADLTLAGGRGPIRNNTYIRISDVD
ncbi:MAG: hypothetical protein RIA69_15815 [Cyclobacteriaceae bacterium]